MDKHRKHYAKGKEFYKKKDFKKAIEEFSKIDVKDLGNFDESIVRHYKALCYAHMMKLGKSIKEFLLAVKFHPNDPKIHLDMGLTYYFFYTKNKTKEFLLKLLGKKNNLEKAMKCFEQGIIVDPKNADCWYYRGYMKELRGRKKEALHDFKESLKCSKKIKNYEKSRLFMKTKNKKSGK
jgi:tetratricopeptide (TPR) repeat protein